MAIPTVNVLVSVYEQDGSPAAGAQVIAKLMTAERYNGFIVPDEYSGITDNNGNCTVSLFPNELGTEGSEYKFKIIHRNGKTVNLFATIPNADCNLHQVVELDRYELRSAGQIVTSEIIGYVNDAYIARDAAQLSESNAQNSADQAYTQANIATTQAAISTTKAGESANSATASLNSANNSASSANTALTYANNANTAKVAAEAARDLANAHKADAQSARDKAQLWADQSENVTVETGKYSAKHHAAKAAASATAASTSKDTATTKATEAATSATTALGHANDAKAYRDTAATYAADALTSKNAAAVSAGNASTSASTASTKAAEAVVSAGQALTYRDQCEDFYQGMVAEGLHSHNNKTILDATTASFTTAEKDKLATVALNANAYVHPASHPATIITEDSTHRFMTDAERTKLTGIAAGAEVNVNADWNATSGDAQILNKPGLATALVDGLMAKGDKSKLDGIAAGAEVNVQADWNATSGDAFILNKPTLGTVASRDFQTDRYAGDTSTPAMCGAFGFGLTAQVYNGNLNDISVTSIYYCSNLCTNRAVEINGWVETFVYSTSGYAVQKYYPYGSTSHFVRKQTSGAWGSWTSPGGDGFLVAKTANQSLSGATLTKITWDNEIYDDFNAFGSSQFTVKNPGRYLIGAHLLINSGTDGQTNYLYMRVNGANIGYSYDKQTGASSFLYGLAIRELSAGDVVECFCQVGTSGEVASSIGTRFWGVRI